jgi:hypothetical protein
VAKHNANAQWLTDADCEVDLEDAMTPKGALSGINARVFHGIQRARSIWSRYITELLPDHCKVPVNCASSTALTCFLCACAFQTTAAYTSVRG